MRAVRRHIETGTRRLPRLFSASCQFPGLTAKCQSARLLRARDIRIPPRTTNSDADALLVASLCGNHRHDDASSTRRAEEQAEKRTTWTQWKSWFGTPRLQHRCLAKV